MFLFYAALTSLAQIYTREYSHQPRTTMQAHTRSIAYINTTTYPKPFVHHYVARTPHRRPHPPCRATQPTATPPATADVVILGAGIIGLWSAHALLRRDPHLRVAVLDKGPGLCTGATGAGQGYCWLSLRTVGTPAWEACVASKALWEAFCQQGLGSSIAQPSAAEACEWMVNGSILVARHADDVPDLQAQGAALQAVGVDAQWLDADALTQAEPSLAAPMAGGLRVVTDAQLVRCSC